MSELQRITWEKVVIRAAVVGRIKAGNRTAALLIADLVDWTHGEYPELKYSNVKAAYMLDSHKPTLIGNLRALEAAGLLEQRVSSTDDGKHINWCPVLNLDVEQIERDYAARRAAYESPKAWVAPEKTEGDRNAEKFLANRTPSPSTEPVKAPAANAQPKDEALPSEEIPEALKAVEPGGVDDEDLEALRRRVQDEVGSTGEADGLLKRIPNGVGSEYAERLYDHMLETRQYSQVDLQPVLVKWLESDGRPIGLLALAGW